MNIRNIIYPSLAIGTILTETLALRVKSKDNDKNQKKILRTINDTRIPFGILTASLPLAVDSVIGGKPLNAIGMGLLASTSLIKLSVNHAQKEKNDVQEKTFLQKIDSYSSHINAVASMLSISQNILNNNKNPSDYVPSLAFLGSALGGMVVPTVKNENLKNTITTASKIKLAVGAMILTRNLFNANKIPQALLTLNLAGLVLSTLDIKISDFLTKSTEGR